MSSRQAPSRRLHEAGVPLLVGTDGTGGGPLFLRELELHVEAGIPVGDVLALATTKAAERLGLAGRTGLLEADFEADIVFLKLIHSTISPMLAVWKR